MTGTVAPDDGLGDRALRSVGWVVVEKWGVRIFSLVVFAILTRLLDAGDFGLLSLATIFVALTSVLVDSGFSKALVQRHALGPKDAATAFWTSLGLAVFVYGCLALASPLIAGAFHDDRLALVLCVLGAVLPISALSSTPAALLEREFRFKALSIRQLIGTFVGASFAIPLALAGAGVWALVAQPLISAVVALIALWTSTAWRPSFEFSRQSLKDLYGVGAGVLGVELLNTLQANIDKLMIGVFFGATAVAYYYVGQKALTTLSELVTTVIARVSLTTFSRVQDDHKRLNRVFQKMTFASASFAIPTFGITAVLAPQIIPFLFGDGWEQSVVVFQLLAISAAFVSVTYYDQNILLAVGRPRAAFLMALGQNVLGVALIFGSLPWGIVGVAASQSVRVLTFWPVRLMTLKRSARIVIGPYVRQVVRCVLAVTPVVVGIAALQLTPWADVPHGFFAFAVPVAVLGISIYVLFAWLLMGESNRAMVREVIKLATSRIRRGGGPSSAKSEGGFA